MWDGLECVSRNGGNTAFKGVDVSHWSNGCGTTAYNYETDYIIGGQKTKPHRFPWTVRIISVNPPSFGFCGGTLITSKHVATAYHCSGGEGKGSFVIMGTDDIKDGHAPNYYQENYYTIPIIGIKYPKFAGLNKMKDLSHDFAVSILQNHATFSEKVRPICLPMQGAEYPGFWATAAGWGMYAKSSVSTKQSDYLRDVQLRVSKKKYAHKKMLGTKMRLKNGMPVDVCSGDSGGPLMIRDRSTKKYILIGTVMGGGYDCGSDNMTSFEGSVDGVWNKVSAHTDWIKELVSNTQ